MNCKRSMAVFAAGVCLGVGPSAQAQVPALISNQGRLFDGTQMLDGDVTMILRVYANPVGGEFLYEDRGTVTVVDGYYATYLGDKTTFGSLTEALAGGEAYVEVIVDDVPYPPRELIPSVAYAFKADQADSVKKAGVTADMIAPDAVTSNHLARAAVTETKLADDAVTSRSIEDGAIGTHDLQDGSVTEDKISDALRRRLDGAAADGNAGTARLTSSGSPLIRVEANPTSANLVGGHIANHAAPGSAGSVVGGGGNASSPNVADGNYTVVDGGLGNAARADYATVGGGLENVASGKRSTVGGGRKNQATASSSGVAAGYANLAGGAYSFIGGGYGNSASGYVGTVAGGWNNQAVGPVSTIGGGQDNTTLGAASSVAGGWTNQAVGFGSAIGGGQLNIAAGSHAVVGGGTNNLATGDASVVAGGQDNVAQGRGSFAAGVSALAAHDGTFVWSDGSSGPFGTTAKNQFLIHAAGNVGIDTDTPTEKLTVQGNVAPAADATFDLGSETLRWRTLYLGNLLDYQDNLTFIHDGRTNLAVGTNGTVTVPGVLVAGQFVGDGSGLTGVTSGALSPGSITDVEISGTAAIDPGKIAGTALTRTTSFGGDVAGTYENLVLRESSVQSDMLADGIVTSNKIAPGAVTREALDDQVIQIMAESQGTWKVGGNDAVDGADSYLGTQANQPLELRVGGAHALRLEPAQGTPNLIGGHALNAVGGTVEGAVISGGGRTGGVNRVEGNFGTVGGGLSNAAGNEYATIGGGINNTAAGSAATIAGGWGNAANDLNATVGGGQDNNAGGLASTVIGGFKNTAKGEYSTVAGGTGNQAGGSHSFAAGHGAQALQDGTFVWSDSQEGPFASTAPNQFLIRASGNVGIDVENPGEKLTVEGNIAPARSSEHTLGTPTLPWHALYVSSHISFEDDMRFVSGGQPRLIVDKEGNINAQGAVTSAAFIGDGSGLSGIDGAAIAQGSLFDAQISQLAAIDPRKVSGTALTESARFSGDVTGTFKTLAIKGKSIDTDKLVDGAVTGEKIRRNAIGINHLQDEVKLALNSATTAWNLGGNRATRGDRDYIGTNDREPFTLRVNGARALRLEPTKGSPNILAGDAKNSIAPAVIGGTVSGGGSISNPNQVKRNYGTVGGGVGNQAAHEYTTVAGGFGNQAEGFDATIAGGQDNVATGSGSTIAGGFTNVTSGSFSSIGGGANNIAAGNVAVVGGGFGNEARGSYAAVPGGSLNLAKGDYSYAAGRRAKANHGGSFVWADAQNADFASTGQNQFLIRAQGGVGINVPNPVFPLQLAGGAYSTGSQWVNASDRNLKENFEPADAQTILERVAALPIQVWNYRTEDDSVKHVGPVAQDFYQAFALGNDDVSISTGDASGIALAAIQALHQENQTLREANQDLQDRLQTIENQLQMMAEQMGIDAP